MHVPLIYSVTLNTMLKCVGCALTIQLSNTDYSAYLLDHKIKTIDEKRKKKENDQCNTMYMIYLGQRSVFFLFLWPFPWFHNAWLESVRHIISQVNDLF